MFMRNRLAAHEIHQFHRMKFKAKGAYHYLLLGERYLKNFSESGVREAIRYLKTALEFDPHYARAYATLSKAYCIAWRFDWDVGLADSLEEALKMAIQAMDLDSHDPAAEAALGFSTFWSKNTTAALSSYERAMQLNPTDPELCADAGMVHSYMGNYGRAATLIKHSLKIDSSNPDYRLWSLADVYHGMQNYREAFGVLQRMSDRTQANRLLAACAVRLGQDASPYVTRVLKDQPHFSVRRWMAIQPLENSEEAADYADALIAAGLPN
jgi:tetratricopeptide (TPR) repeat protein